MRMTIGYINCYCLNQFILYKFFSTIIVHFFLPFVLLSSNFWTVSLVLPFRMSFSLTHLFLPSFSFSSPPFLLPSSFFLFLLCHSPSPPPSSSFSFLPPPPLCAVTASPLNSSLLISC